MKTFFLLLGLRWQLLRNQHSNRWTIPVIVSVTVLIYAVVGVLFGYALRYPDVVLHTHEASAWAATVNYILGLAAVFAVIINLLSSGHLLDPLDTAPLRHLPLSRMSVFVAVQGVGALNFFYIATTTLFIGFAAGLGAMTTSVGAFLILMVYAVAFNIGLHCCVEILRLTIENLCLISRREKFVAALMIGTLVFVVVNRGTGSWDRLIAATPIGWMTGALHTLVFGHMETEIYRAAGMFLAVVLCEIAALFLCVALNLRLLERSMTSGKGHAGSDPGVNAEQFFFHRSALVHLIAKDVLSLVRSRGLRSQYWAMAVLFACFTCMTYFKIFDLKGPGLTFYFLFVPITIWDAYIGNIFGTDHRSFTALITLHIPPRQLILSKNIGYAIVILPSLVMSWLFMAVFAPTLHLPLFILGQMAVYVILCTLGNYRSLWSAYPVQRNERLNSSGKNERFSGRSIAGLVVTLVCSGIITYAVTAAKGMGISYLLLVVFLGVSAAAYWKLLRTWSDTFTERSESLYHQLKIS